MIDTYALRGLFWNTLCKVIFFICYPTEKMRKDLRSQLPFVDDPNAIQSSRLKVIPKSGGRKLLFDRSKNKMN